MVEAGVLAFAGVIIASALTTFGVILGVQAKRITDIEDDLAEAKTRVDSAKKYNMKLWEYCRALLDLYYRHRREDAPDPPKLPAEDDD